MILVWSQAGLDARFVGGLQGLLDEGPGPARIQLFGSSSPGSGQVLAELVLAKPSGSLVAGNYVLLQGDSEGDLVAKDGVPLSGRVFSGAGVRVCDADVSDAEGDGVIKVEAEGGGPQLYAGGRVRLVDSNFF